MKFKKRQKAIMKRLVKIGYWVVLFFCSFVVLGTLLYFIPLVSDLASNLFMPLYIPLLVLILLFVAASAGFLVRKRVLKRAVTFGVSVLTLAAFIFISVFTVVNVNAQGEKISYLKLFKISSYRDVEEQVAYYTDQEGKNVDLSVFYTEDGTQNKPVIFYTHGGGWITGDRYDRLGTTKTFAQNGYVVVSADYDLSSEEINLYDFTEEQLLCAVKWMRENVKDFGGDIRRLYFVGDSAGGNLALELAYKINSGVYENYPQVKAVSVMYPVTDIRAFYENENLLTSMMCKKMARSYLGAIPKDAPVRYEQYNPANFIGSKTPPTLMTLGTSDSSVPPQATYHFAKVLSGIGVDNQVIKVPFANHVGDKPVNTFLGQAYVNNTLRWFEQNK